MSGDRDFRGASAQRNLARSAKRTHAASSRIMSEIPPKPRISAAGAALVAVGTLAFGGVVILALVSGAESGSRATLPAFLAGVLVGTVSGIIAIRWSAQHVGSEPKRLRTGLTSPIVLAGAGAAALLRLASVRWQVGIVAALCVWFATVMLGASIWIANGGSFARRPRHR